MDGCDWMSIEVVGKVNGGELRFVGKKILMEKLLYFRTKITNHYILR